MRALTQHFVYQDRREKLSERKSFLYNQYQRLLQESEFVLLFHTDNMNVPLLQAVRREIASVKLPDTDLARLAARHGVESWDLPTSTLTMARTGLLRPACRRDAAEAVQGLEAYLYGQVMMLTCPVLSPNYLGKVLRAINKPMSAAANDEQPGRKTPVLTPVAAVVERSRLIEAPQLPALTKLQDLATLRAEIVGLLSAPGHQLAGILSQAGGATLAATLEARRRDLASS